MKKRGLRRIAEPLIALIDELGLILLLLAIALYYLVSRGILTIVEAAIVFGGIMLFVVFLVYRVAITYSRDIAVGKEALKGKRAIVIEDLQPEGKVLLEGEIWRARSIDKSRIPSGERVYVVDVEDLTLIVARR
ncbi:MAG: hypothetical protein F7C81_05010 [Desulfurococcales archaeon]|nr:hypothetical protein [Desulfurococcales archaeon]